MKIPRVIVVDCESEKIVDGARVPPVPGGASIHWPSEHIGKYWAWGHDSGNNCDKANARRELMRAWTSPEPKLFFNAKFDIKTLTHAFDLPPLTPEQYHDAMFLLFLYDPHQRNMKLKPSAERILGLPATEGEIIRDWLIEHKVITKQQANKWIEHILRAPGDVAARYVKGDTTKTKRLFEFLYKDISERGMLPAYERELKVMPIFMRNEIEGLKVDIDGLRRDIPAHEAQLNKCDNWLRKRLGVPDLNIDADKDMGEALDRAGIITDWVLTKTGQKSVAKKNLKKDMYIDQRVFSTYGYRNRLATCIRMFEKPWLEKAEESGGWIHGNWNQVRQAKTEGDDNGGTRTGRPSMNNPNLLNLSKDWYSGPGHQGYFHPTHIKLPELPLVRRYILPDTYGRTPGVFLHRDFSQQELRILAHFEDGELLARYQADPRMDVHDFVMELMASAGYNYERRAIKTINFGIIYGKGAGLFAEELGSTVGEAKALLRAHGEALPGVKQLQDEIKALVKQGLPIRTWAGREYFVEPPFFWKEGGRTLTFEYKLLNYCVQGSAADATKEALIRYDSVRKESRLLTTVYDEINISAPQKAAAREMKLLREAMESVEFDVKLLSDGKSGPNWAELTKYKEAA